MLETDGRPGVVNAGLMVCAGSLANVKALVPSLLQTGWHQPIIMDKPPPPPLQRHIAYRGLVITIEFTGSGDQISARADLRRDGEFLGRVALKGPNGEALLQKLEVKAKGLADSVLAEPSPIED